jgi:hypothetical protein
MAACGQLKTMGDPAAMRDRPAVTTVGAGRLAAARDAVPHSQ